MWLFSAALLFIAADKPKLMKVKVNDAITVSVPKDWLPMQEEDIGQRYPSVRAPLMAYTNQERVADFSVNISATQWPDDDIELAKKFFKAGLVNVFDRVDMIEEGIHEVRGNKLIFFEFESRINGVRQLEGQNDPVLRYTYIQYFLEPGRAVVFSFNCPRRDRELWQETARAMMREVRIK
ncbi:MAG TPA: hypothetical protein VK589_14780 [Chryseolinea sp.]|nr:hypothetical protein [Chryseolinea sp.]